MAQVERTQEVEIERPRESVGPVRWIKENLFNTWYNALLTLVALGFLYVILTGVLTWVFGSAEWGVIPANLQLLMIGTYPRAELWRVWTVVYTLAALSGVSAGIWGGLPLRFALSLGTAGLVLAAMPVTLATRGWLLGAVAVLAVAVLLGRGRRRWRGWVLGGWLLSFPWTMIVLRGFGENTVLPSVLTSQWGGLLLTLVLAAVGIAASFPLGVLLALGRRSSLPAVSWISTLYIEVVRGVPLVTILFMAQIMVPIFLPDFRIDKIFRAMIGLTLFSAAYMAENVRGGLQGVPQGQYDAAQAVGLNYPLSMLLIILPQALRSVIPSIVGQFISLFKDTSLVAIIGLLDLLGIARSVIANPDWLGLQAEVFLFAAVTYFIFSYSMSYASRKLEVALGVGRR
ncbi:MAG: amino acid ABC transporter permease [Candidatus Bipolaricaulia bacterium]